VPWEVKYSVEITAMGERGDEVRKQRLGLENNGYGDEREREREINWAKREKDGEW
jgi:hypothetical protein